MSYLQQMDSVMNCIPQLNVPTIVTGDFNIDLLSKSGSESKLTKFMRYYGFRQLITEPTHRFGSLLDHICISTLILLETLHQWLHQFTFLSIPSLQVCFHRMSYNQCFDVNSERKKELITGNLI